MKMLGHHAPANSSDCRPIATPTRTSSQYLPELLRLPHSLGLLSELFVTNQIIDRGGSQQPISLQRPCEDLSGYSSSRPKRTPGMEVLVTDLAPSSAVSY